MKIRAVGAELFSADRQADKKESNSRFSQFCKRSKKFSPFPPSFVFLYVSLERRQNTTN